MLYVSRLYSVQNKSNLPHLGHRRVIVQPQAEAVKFILWDSTRTFTRTRRRLARSVAVFRTWIGLALVVLACGCGGPQFGRVSGTVTMDGKPLPGVAVRFEDEGGSATIARTDKSGYYELRYTVDQVGAPVGKHKVTILTPPKDEVSTGEREKEVVPARYNRESTLTADVKSGRQTIDWELTSKAN